MILAIIACVIAFFAGVGFAVEGMRTRAGHALRAAGENGTTIEHELRLRKVL